MEIVFRVHLFIKWDLQSEALKSVQYDKSIRQRREICTMEPLKTGTSVNWNSLETEQLARTRIFILYFHCLKISVNWNPSIPETGQAFYYF